MSSQLLRTCSALALAAWVGLTIPSETYARKPFWRMQSRRSTSESFVSTTYTAAPVPDPIEMTFFKCQGENGNCGIIARGTVEPGAGPSPVPVVAVYMLVNQACPTGCSGSSFSCTNPTDAQVRGTAIWNGATNKYDVTFGDISSPGDRRIVKCDTEHTFCIVVCYQGGGCSSREYTKTPSSLQGTAFGNLTVECVYCNSAGGAGGGVP